MAGALSGCPRLPTLRRMSAAWHYVVYFGDPSHGPTAFIRTSEPLELGARLEHDGRAWRVASLDAADLGIDAVAFAVRA